MQSMSPATCFYLRYLNVCAFKYPAEVIQKKNRSNLRTCFSEIPIMTNTCRSHHSSFILRSRKKRCIYAQFMPD